MSETKVSAVKQLSDNLTYFTADGTYGRTEQMLIVDTTTWTKDEWQRIEECGDNYRTQIVANILGQHQFSLYANTPCDACQFDIDDDSNTTWITCEYCDWGNV